MGPKSSPQVESTRVRHPRQPTRRRTHDFNGTECPRALRSLLTTLDHKEHSHLDSISYDTLRFSEPGVLRKSREIVAVDKVKNLRPSLCLLYASEWNTWKYSKTGGPTQEEYRTLLSPRLLMTMTSDNPDSLIGSQAFEASSLCHLRLTI